ncbi:NADH:flavin oxidoreductase/NADH oxidase [Cohnella suwonensis]|uniref:NADH:flavin oxidoreductase/NADH oxidase n=1 Tax=Cohnella suwonensis TaxID=696072 RepID=A0ABW0LQN8_9BACL
MTRQLFSSFAMKGMHLKNRVVMAPMCQYAVTERDGKPNEWHYIHYLSRAIGGTGLIIMEMTDIDPDGRITEYDLGLWSDEQIPAFARIIEGIHAYHGKVGIQIAHAGRKTEFVTTPIAPSALKYPGSPYRMPRALTTEEIQGIIQQFADAVGRAVKAGVDTIELHGAHGYLIHQFQSPLTNKREDQYGQDLSRFGVEVIQAVKREMPADMPLIFRISAVEYADGGYDIDHAIQLSTAYKAAGVDVFHVSTGGEGPVGTRQPGNYPGYQVTFAHQIREVVNVPVIAVGLLEDPMRAESIIQSGEADFVAIGRALLRDPYWAAHAAITLGQEQLPIPKPYQAAY